tara:strand:- start:495 stop:683 length:189 start_codon:yes stop_codon:yes gene_type:complete
MKKIIEEILKQVACGNTGNCQINLQSQSAQQMIADKISEGLEPYINDLIENLVCGSDQSIKD